MSQVTSDIQDAPAWAFAMSIIEREYINDRRDDDADFARDLNLLNEARNDVARLI